MCNCTCPWTNVAQTGSRGVPGSWGAWNRSCPRIRWEADTAITGDCPFLFPFVLLQLSSHVSLLFLLTLSGRIQVSDHAGANYNDSSMNMFCLTHAAYGTFEQGRCGKNSSSNILVGTGIDYRYSLSNHDAGAVEEQVWFFGERTLSMFMKNIRSCWFDHWIEYVSSVPVLSFCVALLSFIVYMSTKEPSRLAFLVCCSLTSLPFVSQPLLVLALHRHSSGKKLPVPGTVCRVWANC